MSDLLTVDERLVLHERLEEISARLRAGVSEEESAKLKVSRLCVLTRLRTDDAKMLRDLLALAGRRGGVKKLKTWSIPWRTRAALWANRTLAGEKLRPPGWVAALPEVKR